jgi:hypothetical protein
MCIVWMLDEILGRYHLGPFDLWWFSSRISLLIFCLDDLSIGDGGVLKSPTTTVLNPFRSFRVCLMKLGACRLIIVISFWCISLFISIECPCLSHLINVSLKSTLSEISIATPACFFRSQWVLAYSFHRFWVIWLIALQFFL